MADYYPLITRAVAGLDKNTGEGRRALYERARTALVDQLRGVTPALSETDITRERLALEEAIRKVESEMARKPSRDMPAAGPPVPPQPPPDLPPRSIMPMPRAPDDPVPDMAGRMEAESQPVAPAAPEMPPEAAEPEKRREPPMPDLPNWTSRPAPAAEAAPPPRPQRPDPFRRDVPRPTERLPLREPRRNEFSSRPSPAATDARKPLRDRTGDFGPYRSRSPEPAPKTADDDGVKGLGDVVADADDLGAAAAHAARSARERYGASQAKDDNEHRPEPRAPAPERGPPRRRPVERRPVPRAELDADIEPEGDARPGYRPNALNRPVEPQPQDGRRFERAGARVLDDEDEDESPLLRRLMKSAVKIGIIALLVLVIGATAYSQRGNILAGVRGVIAMVRGPATPAPPSIPRVNEPQRAKIPDRIGEAESRATPQQQAEAPVAQRVVLYEEDPAEPSGKRSLGTAVWRTENVSPGPGQPVDRQVRADITIPDRNMQITWTLRRNADKDLPASHTVAIMFTVPADFDHGGIAEIRGVLMKQAEQARGTSLSGLAVKVTTGYFLIGLSSQDQDIPRNVQLLKERGWLDIAIIYNDGRRAILAMEKGTPGDRAFQQAFAAWGQ